jgi:hypothetical protein
MLKPTERPAAQQRQTDQPRHGHDDGRQIAGGQPAERHGRGDRGGAAQQRHGQTDRLAPARDRLGVVERGRPGHRPVVSQHRQTLF